MQSSGVSADNSSSSPTSSSSIIVKPYQWMDPEERKQKNRIELPKVNPEAIIPPPLHRDRSLTPSNLKSPSPIHAALLERKSTSPVPIATSSIVKETPADHPNNTSQTFSHGIAGVHEESTVSFPPPPKSSTFRNADVQTPTVSKSTSNEPITAPVASTRQFASRTSHRVPRNGDPRNKADDLPPAAVLGNYDYNVEVGFAPPPKPYRSQEQHQQQHPKQHQPWNSQPPLQKGSSSARQLPQVPARSSSSSVPQTLPVEPTSEPLAEPPTESSNVSSTMAMLSLDELSPPPQRSVALTSAPAPDLPDRTFDPPPRYSTQETIPPIYKPAEITRRETNTKKGPPPVKPKPNNLHSSSARKVSPQVPKKKDTLRAHAAPPVPQKKFTLSDLETKLSHTTDRHANAGVSNVEDEEDSVESNPFRRYLKNAVPKENDHIHKR